MERFRTSLETLYTGRGRQAAAFRYGLIVFDILTIVFFILSVPYEAKPGVLAIDVVLGILIAADFAARLWIAPDKLRMLRQIYTITDFLVVLSLLLAPFFTQSLGFLRVFRTLRLLHSYQVLRDLRSEGPFFRRNEDVIVSAVNLGVFVFFVTALVYVLQHGRNPGINSFVDALYFTVGTLTTTGYGDVTLQGDLGRLLSAFIMLAGVALFLRLAQAVFRPQKVRHVCGTCGLGRHEPDSVHCKHCGSVLKIRTEGGD